MIFVDDQLGQAVAAALKKAQQREKLPSFVLPEPIPIERPKQEEMGDWATPICLQLARYARMAPIKIAETVAEILRERYVDALPFLAEVEVAHPGFINFRLDESWLARQVEIILSEGETFGRLDLGRGIKVQVEYVSANPTGPLHMGSARNAVLGDALASVLEAAGYEVQREYYVNDAGSRMQAFYESLYARYAQALGQEEALPEEGYHGPYMIELGRRIAAEHGPRFLLLPRDEGVRAVGELGLEAVVQSAREDLALMGIRYDCWFSERSLYERGQHEKVMTILREGGHLYLQDGAVWFRATALGGDKDEVVIRSNGTPGYFASDIAYHYNKFVERGFDRVIDVWGADHQGHVPRMKAMMRALGLDPERLTIIIYQLVTLKRGGEVVRLSKRTGDIITLREVLEEVGPDAMRYFLLSRSADSQMDFDIDLAKEQSEENPVYYVQYAHARICSILRHAEEVRQSLSHALQPTDGDVGLLTHPAELALIRRMVRLPETVRLAANQLAPHHLTYYAYDLAQAFHAFYRDCRVVSSDPADAAITQARLKLVTACRLVLARTLKLMGMNAPETM
ncbi:MAG: arginine--tRNA ligase [Chloroflexi bacterium]|nr:arginine--tRNA ligase [Chloroflexota bacterium]